MSRIMWDRNTGDEIIVQDDEADPKGALDHHPSDTEKGGGGRGKHEDDTAEAPMTHEELIAALESSGTPFAEDATDEQLTEQLSALARSALAARKVKGVSAKDGPRALLAKLQEAIQAENAKKATK